MVKIVELAIIAVFIDTFQINCLLLLTEKYYTELGDRVQNLDTECRTWIQNEELGYRMKNLDTECRTWIQNNCSKTLQILF